MSLQLSWLRATRHKQLVPDAQRPQNDAQYFPARDRSIQDRCNAQILGLSAAVAGVQRQRLPPHQAQTGEGPAELTQ
jgi:hypothetical protein